MPKVTVNDIEMYFEIKGRGTPLVFIHGLGSSSKDWEHQVADFYHDYMVITVDLRGHGETDAPPGEYSIDLFASDVAALLKQIVTVPAHVVGLSLGSAVAWHLALDYADTVRTLILTNMSAEVPVKTLPVIWAFYFRVLLLRVFGFKKMGSVLARKLFPKPEHAVQRQKLIRRIVRNNKTAYLNAMYALKNWSVMDRLDQVQCPVLVIAGDQDYSPVAHKEAYTGKMPKASLQVIEDARHALPLEWPEQFNRKVKQFLGKHQTG